MIVCPQNHTSCWWRGGLVRILTGTLPSWCDYPASCRWSRRCSTSQRNRVEFGHRIAWWDRVVVHPCRSTWTVTELGLERRVDWVVGGCYQCGTGCWELRMLIGTATELIERHYDDDDETRYLNSYSSQKNRSWRSDTCLFVVLRSTSQTCLMFSSIDWYWGSSTFSWVQETC